VLQTKSVGQTVGHGSRSWRSQKAMTATNLCRLRTAEGRQHPRPFFIFPSIGTPPASTENPDHSALSPLPLGITNRRALIRTTNSYVWAAPYGFPTGQDSLSGLDRPLVRRAIALVPRAVAPPPWSIAPRY
jgi:hypothetical protein